MSRRLWIVWLMLALLPLRGWAATTMMIPVSAGGAMPVVAHAGASHHGAAPCHEESSTSETATSGHACTLCDVCHAAVATAPAALIEPLPSPAGTLAPESARDTGRCLAGGLDRPPRASLG
jgi:cytochrome c553